MTTDAEIEAVARLLAVERDAPDPAFNPRAVGNDGVVYPAGEPRWRVQAELAWALLETARAAKVKATKRDPERAFIQLFERQGADRAALDSLISSALDRDYVSPPEDPPRKPAPEPDPPSADKPEAKPPQGPDFIRYPEFSALFGKEEKTDD